MTQTGAPYQITIDGTTLAVEGIRGYFHSRRAGLDAHLVTRLATFLDDAHDSIDCAIYDLRHPAILDALARAVARGVRVRIAFDGGRERAGGLSADPKPDGTAAALDKAGLLSHAIAVHEHGRHLMHDKFVLRDGRDIWVGSANFTEGGLELQDNICLMASSRQLVARFATTFAELVQPQHRHALSPAALVAVETTSVTVGSTNILPMFAPAAGESIEQEIIAAIRGAQRIRIMAFLLSDPGILQALAPLAQVPDFDIRGVYDPHGMEDVLRYTRQDHALFWFMHDPRFVAAPSHAFSPEHEQDFMHNKTLVIGDQLVFTGSYNFSENAEANDEVSLKIESEAIAAACSNYCEVLFQVYGGVVDAPQGSKRQSNGSRPRVNTLPRPRITAPPVYNDVAADPHPGTAPRLPAITMPGLSAITAPRLRAITSTAPSARPITAPPAVPTATAATTAAATTAVAEMPAETPVAPTDTPGSSTTRTTLDILIKVVWVLIAAVLAGIVVTVVSSGIIHL